MKIDENKIFEEIQKLRLQGLSKSDTLFELLGGDMLNGIFDQQTIDSIMRSFVNNNQLHPLVAGSGIDVLEGLINKEIIGDLEQFYNLKPEYILTLPTEQQALMAKSLAGENKAQEELLISAWAKGLKTCACGGESEHQYMMFEVDSNDSQKVAIMQQISKACDDKVSISLSEGNITVSFYGEEQNFYSKITSVINEERQPDKFICALLEAVDDNNSFKSGIIESKNNQIEELNQTLEETLEENVNLHQENQMLKTNLANVREWITKRLVKIPLVGKTILKSMEKEQKLLQGKNGVER